MHCDHSLGEGWARELDEDDVEDLGRDYHTRPKLVRGQGIRNIPAAYSVAADGLPNPWLFSRIRTKARICVIDV